MMDLEVKALPSDQVHFQALQWAWSRYRIPVESGTQEGRTCRGEAAEWNDAAAAAAAAGQKPVGTGAAVRGGREGQKGGGNEGRTFHFMVNNGGNKM